MPARTRASDADPLALILAPPKDESPADRWAREQREAHARAISDRIDAEIKAEKLDRKKRPEPIKVLLLGQSESGKSTTVKNFQLAYAYSSFLEERTAWRAVIHLNLVRSVNTILDVLAAELARPAPAPARPLSPPPSSPSHLHPFPHPMLPDALMHPPDDPTTTDAPAGPSNPTTEHDPETDPEGEADPDPDPDDADADADPAAPAPIPPALRLLHLRLAPLRQVQADLERTLGAPELSTAETAGKTAAPWVRPREFGVVSRSGWKSALRRVGGFGPGAEKAKAEKKAGVEGRASIGSRDEARDETASVRGERRGVLRLARASLSLTRPTARSPSPRSPSDDDADGEAEVEAEASPRVRSAAEVIASCAEDMAALWADAGVRALLARRKVRVEEGSGFFLDDVARVAARGYAPSDEDVVRARLRTMGVQEYRFIFEKGSEAGREWRIYDVGGARSSRHAWYPYFEDMNAIIFLAPISCFDERLAEDRRVNRLQDSLLLWKAVVGSELLKNVQMILFLNKCDLLQVKLSRGVRVVDYVPSYGDRPNESRHVARYFRQQFKDLSIRHSPEPRGFFSFLTSVVDTKATAVTVATVREGIQRSHLKGADVI